MYIFLAFITGTLVIISMIINSHLAGKIGTFAGTFINYSVGLTLILLIIMLKKNSLNFTYINLLNFPSWIYLGGALGVIVVAISNLVIPKIPTIYSTLLIFIGQLFTGIVLDHFTGYTVSIWKMIGGFFIVAGLFYNFNVDRKQLKKVKRLN